MTMAILAFFFDSGWHFLELCIVLGILRGRELISFRRWKVGA